MGWTFVWMMLVLQLPILGLFGICWWALRDAPDAAGQSSDDGGVKRPPSPHPRRPVPRRGGPRRDPHGAPSPAPPPRMRTTVARSRQFER